MSLNTREVRTGKIMVEFFFGKFLQLSARSINMRNKELDQCLSTRSEQASAVNVSIAFGLACVVGNNCSVVTLVKNQCIDSR